MENYLISIIKIMIPFLINLTDNTVALTAAAPSVRQCRSAASWKSPFRCDLRPWLFLGPVVTMFVRSIGRPRLGWAFEVRKLALEADGGLQTKVCRGKLWKHFETSKYL